MKKIKIIYSFPQGISLTKRSCFLTGRNNFKIKDYFKRVFQAFLLNFKYLIISKKAISRSYKLIWRSREILCMRWNEYHLSAYFGMLMTQFQI